MAFTLWLSAEEERILEGIMRREGTRTKAQAVIMAIRDKAAALEAEQQGGATPAVAASLPGPSAHRA
jgi:hypothetical protein